VVNIVYEIQEVLVCENLLFMNFRRCLMYGNFSCAKIYKFHASKNLLFMKFRKFLVCGDFLYSKISEFFAHLKFTVYETQDIFVNCFTIQNFYYQNSLELTAAIIYLKFKPFCN
jgi:hypothetical protein